MISKLYFYTAAVGKILFILDLIRQYHEVNSYRVCGNFKSNMNLVFFFVGVRKCKNSCVAIIFDKNVLITEFKVFPFVRVLIILHSLAYTGLTLSAKTYSFIVFMIFMIKLSGNILINRKTTINSHNTVS